MKVDVERIDGNKVALTVEVEAERVESAIANVLVDTRRRVTLPGFRKGKAPRALLERYIGLEVLCQEAQQELLPEAFQEAVQEAAIEPVDVEFDVSDLQPNESFRFKAIVEVKPEINLPDFRAYDIEMEQASVSDEDVEQALQRLQEQHAVLRSVPEDTPAAQGHQVIIDYSAQTADGEPQRRENVPLMLGSGVFPEFEEQIVGLRTGEEKEFTLSVPKSEGEAEDVEENEVTYQIKVKEIKEKELPAVDDGFAATVGEFASVQELRNDIENRLKETAFAQAKAKFAESVLERIEQEVEFSVPSKLLEQQENRMINRVANSFVNQEAFQEFLERTEQSLADLREQFRPRAEKDVRRELILEAIAKQENLEVAEEAVEAEVAYYARALGQPVAQARKMLAESGELSEIRIALQRDAAWRWLEELGANKKEE
ncbi:MAG TPA: trigger factor [Firmicutes bacterium]|jgi:trigger factor|nr:trigger factor [Bacillota bacterium]